MKKKHLLAGIDVGTTKICATIAESEGERVSVLGTGWVPSKGLRKGAVVNLSETIDSVKAALEQAESQARSVVESAYVSVGGSLLRGVNSRGEAEVRSRGGEVTADDIGRAVEDAKNFEIPDDYEVIHVLTRTFTLDGQNGIVNPIGMSGRHLSVSLHLVLNASAVVQNIVNAINKSGVVVSGVVMQQLASADSVLTSDEKELGTILVDIGGGTTDIAIFQKGSICHSEVLPMGGSLVTKDIAIGLKAPLGEAEQLKVGVGSVFPEAVPEEEFVEVGEVGSGRTRTIPRQLLCQIVQARGDEILQAIARLRKKLGVKPDLVTGVVVTGGGALLEGFVERAEQILEMPVRLGFPLNVVDAESAICHPGYATSLGLLTYARQAQGDELLPRAELASAAGAGTGERVKNWFLEKIS